MTATQLSAPKNLPRTPWGALPPRMRVLFITGLQRTGAWLAEALAADSAAEVVLQEAAGMAAGLAELRDEVFDAVLVSHDESDLDALELLDAIRAGSNDDQPMIVLGAESEQEMAALCFEAGADAYICVHATTTRALIWQVARAVERHQLMVENRRLQQSQHHQLQLEHDEAERLLGQQRDLISGLEHLNSSNDPARALLDVDGDGRQKAGFDLPDTLIVHYRELLRAHVIMGSGNLTNEMQQLAQLLSTANVSAQQMMLLHLKVLEEMVQGLGCRSARHVINRADLLVLEVMMHLTEGYRQRLCDQARPPRQLELPGF